MIPLSRVQLSTSKKKKKKSTKMHTNFMQVMDGQSHINKSQTTIVFIMENKKTSQALPNPTFFIS